MRSQYDKGEPRVKGVSVQIKGGTITYNDKDTLIYIANLEPYANSFLEINSEELEFVSWQIKNKSIKIAPDANNFRMIEVPVSIAGEVSGTVTYTGKDQKAPKGLGQILVCIYDQDLVLVTKMVTESDGYFNYMGLKPGTYTMRVDTCQMRKVGFCEISTPFTFTIKGKIEGDMVEGLSLVIGPKLSEPLSDQQTHLPLPVAAKPQKETNRKDSITQAATTISPVA